MFRLLILIPFGMRPGPDSVFPVRLSDSASFLCLSDRAWTVLPLRWGCLLNHWEVLHKYNVFNHPFWWFSVCDDFDNAPQPNTVSMHSQLSVSGCRHPKPRIQVLFLKQSSVFAAMLFFRPCTQFPVAPGFWWVWYLSKLIFWFRIWSESRIWTGDTVLTT